MSSCQRIRELLCSPPELSDFYRGSDPVPNWVPELGQTPLEGPRGRVSYDGHLARILGSRRVIERQWKLTWDFPATTDTTDLDDDAFLREVLLGRNDFLVSAYRWAWTGSMFSPGEPNPNLDPLLTQLYTPLFIDYGTSEVKVTDSPQNIVALWGSPRAWAYPPRTFLYRAGQRLEMRAQADWSLMNLGATPVPATRLDVIVHGLELIPRSA